MLVAVPKPVRAEKPRKRLQTRTRLVTKTPVKPRNAKRAAKRRAENFPERTGNERCAIEVKASSSLAPVPSDWSRCWGPIDAAHVVHARGMGGTGSNRDEVVYLCRGHHTEQEGHSAAFEARYGVDLKELAAEQARSSRVV